MVVDLLVSLVAAAAVSLLLTPLVIRFTVARGILDVPGGRRIHTQPVPSLGGVAVFAGTLAGAVWFVLATPPLSADAVGFLTGLAIGGAVLFGTGLVDDLFGVSPAAKLALQGVAAAALVYFGFRVDAVSFGGDVVHALGPFALPLTMLWLIGITNAFNLIDGLDGLAATVALVALVMVCAVGGALGNSVAVLVAVCLSGGLLGFLRYNFSPARVFLGDSGSLFIGFTLAAVSVKAAQLGSGAVFTFVPLLALALPLLDTSLAIARRWLRGSPISAPDRRHIHHQLLSLGLSQRQVVGVLCLAASSLALLGVFIAFASAPLAFWVGLAGGSLVLLVLLEALRKLRYHEFEETGSAVLSAMRKARRVIRDRIEARDATELIAAASDLPTIRTTLAGQASRFNFLHMEICRESEVGRRKEGGAAAGAWKLDYPLLVDSGGADLPVLRIWCERDGVRPYGAERVARIIGPALDEWLRRRVEAGLHEPTLMDVPLPEPIETRVLRSV